MPLDEAMLEAVANTRMPFGKYKDTYLIDLPEAYLVWFKQQDGRVDASERCWKWRMR